MKPTILTLFSFFFFVNFYAQRPKHDWQIQAGLHIVDLYPVGKSSTFFPNQGNFLEDFGNIDHWNLGVPALGIFR